MAACRFPESSTPSIFKLTHYPRGQLDDLHRAKRGVATLTACVVQTLNESDPSFEGRFLDRLGRAYRELKDNSDGDVIQEMELLSWTREYLTVVQYELIEASSNQVISDAISIYDASIKLIGYLMSKNLFPPEFSSLIPRANKTSRWPWRSTASIYRWAKKHSRSYPLSKRSSYQYQVDNFLIILIRLRQWLFRISRFEPASFHVLR